ncbi:hypothetical protein BJN34_21585 [Cupriavidus necator]|uniref:Curli production assembly/transport component CsgE n=2 Tax=Cupriavidus necator TaxID=106590 RepID=A0A1U9UUW3_CUPNE|nr:hypothetical protein BJN34_21585 [Cupriavidus necator]
MVVEPFALVHAADSADSARVEPAPISLPSTPTAPGIQPAPNGKSTVTGASTVSNSTTLISPGVSNGAPNGHMPNGAKASEINGRQSLADSLGGIVTNQVMTIAGQDFYSYFAEAWRDLPLTDRYVVSVRERPSARWGSLIWVEFESRRVFEQFLPPRRAALKQIAERAAAVAYDNVVQADIARLLFRDADLAADEM